MAKEERKEGHKYPIRLLSGDNKTIVLKPYINSVRSYMYIDLSEPVSPGFDPTSRRSLWSALGQLTFPSLVLVCVHKEDE